MSSEAVWTDGLYPYQAEAFGAWIRAGRNGLLEMATGTGKTRVARACIRSVVDFSPSFVVVVAPSVHIGKQWLEELASLNPVEANGSNPAWEKSFRRDLRQVSFGKKACVLVVAVMNTAATKRFVDLAFQAAGQVKNSLFVGDEVHWLGAPEFRKALLSVANFRLGLSATPQRYFDDDGTDALRAYFGEKPVYQLPIREALKKLKPNGQPLLTPYKYFPCFVSLTDDEVGQYQKYARTMAMFSSSENFDPIRVRNARVAAARVVKKASQKEFALGALLDDLSGRLKYGLVYCEDKEQMLMARNELHKRNIYFGEITEAENSFKRQEVLANFSEGYIDVILAMRCLDEGVDIPEARIGIILASSANPREFIQRRGRLMRTAPGKEFAEIYDFAVLATPEILEKTGLESVKDKEIFRITEFSEDAMNAKEVESDVSGLWVL